LLAVRVHVLRRRADAFVPGYVRNARQVRRHRGLLGQRAVPKVMQRQVPDFLFREASRIARRISERRAAVERAPNQAGPVAVPIQKRLLETAWSSCDFDAVRLDARAELDKLRRLESLDREAHLDEHWTDLGVGD
jgi:hypothetical protein